MLVALVYLFLCLGRIVSVLLTIGNKYIAFDVKNTQLALISCLKLNFDCEHVIFIGNKLSEFRCCYSLPLPYRIFCGSFSCFGVHTYKLIDTISFLVFVAEKETPDTSASVTWQPQQSSVSTYENNYQHSYNQQYMATDPVSNQYQTPAQYQAPALQSQMHQQPSPQQPQIYQPSVPPPNMFVPSQPAQLLQVFPTNCCFSHHA